MPRPHTYASGKSSHECIELCGIAQRKIAVKPYVSDMKS